jgi:hypothetical protein
MKTMIVSDAKIRMLLSSSFVLRAEVHVKGVLVHIERQDRRAASQRVGRRVSTCTTIAGYEREVWSVQAQSPRQSECCAELGRKPSDGESANSPEQNYS